VHWLKYLGNAFNARPFGMPVPPLWFAVVVSTLLGAFVSPALMLIGLGATGLAAALIASNARFQLVVDARAYQPVPVTNSKSSLLARLDNPSRERQAKLETQCTALQQVLENANAGQEHIAGVWQLSQLHLRLLVARSAALAVTDGGDDDAGKTLETQLDDVKKRLTAPNLDSDLHDALDDQRKVLEQRVEMQAEAKRRLQLLDAELDRIREQIALIREQALLTSDPSAIARSVDSLSTFLNESGRWLKDQEKIFGDIDSLDSDPFQSTPPLPTSGKTRMGETQ
jgi:chromosome segregation ATPase